ncbi:hypothetical protein ACSAZK_13315 [Methanosarcina sp. Mfa9]|uniref:hypothetical protein n=1 Tax=Methanosarcina sp. Mfa9 TaxID=3439063 RepID=UPI003F87D3D4
MNDQYIRATSKRLTSNGSVSKENELVSLYHSFQKKSSIRQICRIPETGQKHSEIKPLKPTFRIHIPRRDSGWQVLLREHAIEYSLNKIPLIISKPYTPDEEFP